MCTRLWPALVIFVLSTELAACSGAGTIPNTRVAQHQPQPNVLLDRYELHDIQNGSFRGTALLDKQTGRVWTLATTTKGTSVTALDFETALVMPAPGSQSCPPNDPLGLYQPQNCTPLRSEQESQPSPK